MSSSFFSSRPSRFLKLLFRLPGFLYKLHLGWLLGRRFLLVVHRGRKTGRVHRTVLEVVHYDAYTRESVVVSGWGTRADWYRNIVVSPALEVQTGGRSFVPEQRVLNADEAAAVLTRFRGDHPREARIFSRMFGVPEEQVGSLAATLPIISFRPAPGGTEKIASEAATGGLGFRDQACD